MSACSTGYSAVQDKPHLKIVKLLVGKQTEMGSFAGAGTGFAYKQYLITAAHVCHGSTDLTSIDPNTNKVEYHKIIFQDAKNEVCIATGFKDYYESIKTAPELSSGDALWSLGYPGFSTTLKTALLTYIEAKVYVLMGLPHYGLFCKGVVLAGMSGGPVLDSENRLVGLNTAGDGVQESIISPLIDLDSLIAEMLP